MPAVEISLTTIQKLKYSRYPVNAARVNHYEITIKHHSKVACYVSVHIKIYN